MLSETLKTLRKHNYMNQTEFARKLGVAQATVSQWEHGLTRPNSEQLKSISNTFGVSIDDLLAGDSATKTPAEAPKTSEARILAKDVDKLPRAQREQALNVVRAMFAEYSDYFNRENGDGT